MVKLNQIESAHNQTWLLSTIDVHNGEMDMTIDFGDKIDTFSFDITALSIMLGYKCRLGLYLTDIQKLHLLWIKDALQLPDKLRYQIWMQVLFNKQSCSLELPERPVLSGTNYNKSFVRITDESHLFYVSDSCYINGVIKTIEIDLSLKKVLGIRWFYAKDIAGFIVDEFAS